MTMPRVVLIMPHYELFWAILPAIGYKKNFHALELLSSRNIELEVSVK